MASTYTYDDGAIKESLLDLIINTSPTETQLGSGLGTSRANDIYHQWNTDTLKTPANNAQVESADTTYDARTNPTRSANYTQIIEIPFQVSDSNRATQEAGFDDRFTYEQAKAMKEWKNDQEFALMRSSLVSGTGSAARQLQGVKNSLSLTTSQSGVSMTETMFNDYLQNVWDNTGVTVNAVYAPMYLKRKISAFTAGTTKNVDANDKRLINAVDVYQADSASMVKLFAHRYVRVSGDTNYDLVGINEDFFKIAYLREPKMEMMAKTGDATNGRIVGEVTLEYRNGLAGFYTQKLL